MFAIISFNSYRGQGSEYDKVPSNANLKYVSIPIEDKVDEKNLPTKFLWMNVWFRFL